MQGLTKSAAHLLADAAPAAGAGIVLSGRVRTLWA